MIRRIIRTVAIVAILVFFAYSLVQPDGGPPVGQPAPAMSGPLLSGESFDLSEHEGRVIVVDFWAMWCGPCVRSLPALQMLNERYAGDANVTILSVNLDDGPDTAERVTAFMAKRNYDFPVMIDAAKRVSGAYGVKTIPTMVFIDGAGQVHKVKVGLFANDPNRIVDHVVASIDAAASY